MKNKKYFWILILISIIIIFSPILIYLIFIKSIVSSFSFSFGLVFFLISIILIYHYVNNDFNKKYFYFLIIFYLIYLFLISISYSSCGKQTWGGFNVEPCNCYGFKKYPFLWGDTECIGIRTCYTNFKNIDNRTKEELTTSAIKKYGDNFLDEIIIEEIGKGESGRFLGNKKWKAKISCSTYDAQFN